VLCAACRKYLRKNGVLPPQEVLDMRDNLRSQRQQAITHAKDECEYCGDKKTYQKKFAFVSDAGYILCQNCKRYFDKYQVLEPLELLVKRFKDRTAKKED
jgi:hypothetical protein